MPKQLISIALILFLCSACNKSEESSEEPSEDMGKEIIQIEEEKEIFDKFRGVHKVTGSRYCWSIDIDSTYGDTLFESSLEFIFTSDSRLKVKESVSSMNELFDFNASVGTESELFYHDDRGARSNATLNIENDSLIVNYCNCGLGQGVSWTFKGKLE